LLFQSAVSANDTDQKHTQNNLRSPGKARKWINRNKAAPKDCESVIGEAESVARENRLIERPRVWRIISGNG
jgi:hypothetical protein